MPSAAAQRRCSGGTAAPPDIRKPQPGKSRFAPHRTQHQQSAPPLRRAPALRRRRSPSDMRALQPRGTGGGVTGSGVQRSQICGSAPSTVGLQFLQILRQRRRTFQVIADDGCASERYKPSTRSITSHRQHCKALVAGMGRSMVTASATRRSTSPCVNTRPCAGARQQQQRRLVRVIAAMPACHASPSLTACVPTKDSRLSHIGSAKSRSPFMSNDDDAPQRRTASRTSNALSSCSSFSTNSTRQRSIRAARGRVVPLPRPAGCRR